MKWFPGSIKDAVTTAKQRDAVFVVFVEGKDEHSVYMASALNRAEISSQLDRDDIVAVRIENNTESLTFFTQIYKVVPVPALYFIGTNGRPIDVVAGSVPFDTLLDAVGKVVTMLDQKKELSPGLSNFIRAEQNAEQNITAGPSFVPDNLPANIEVAREPTAEEKLEGAKRLVEALSEPSTEEKLERAKQHVEVPKDPSVEEKLERAKQLIELQRQQKAEKEREEEKRREIERRQLGKDLQQLKNKQQDQAIKLALEERMKEKAAEAEAKERVLRQIAQDKLERKQREIALQKQNAAQQQASFQEDRPSSSGSSSSDSSVARIQFRLPSGNPHTGKFDSCSTLGSLRSYVIENIDLPFQNFAMSTTFPRRDLTVEDDGKTLRELELVPTAVILILPVKNSKISTAVTSSEDGSFFSRFIWALFVPILSIYNFVMGYFTGGPTNPPERPRGSETAGGNENAERIGRISGQPSGSSINRNILGGPTTTIRSRGNIHRLHSGGDENDENNTWNGNSTQQM